MLVVAGFAADAQMEFVENKGQWNSKVNFRGDFITGSFFLENRGFTVLMHNAGDLQQVNESFHGHQNSKSITNAAKHDPHQPTAVTLRSHAYKVYFSGGNASALAVPDKPLPTHSNYFIGSDKTKWASNCSVYEHYCTPRRQSRCNCHAIRRC
jgi:hypothetical protein